MNKQTQKRKTGFTLVELMVVAIIVAILAAVAIPLMSGNKKRAMGTEAEAALGTVRSQLRAMFAETGDYTKKPNGTTLGTGSVTNVPGVSQSDMVGRYWDWDSYTIDAIAAGTFTLKATGVSTGETAGITISMTERGIISRTGM
jgi:prepilin-type N-terminal cleavage/methylation domain-containing protein